MVAVRSRGRECACESLTGIQVARVEQPRGVGGHSVTLRIVIRPSDGVVDPNNNGDGLGGEGAASTIPHANVHGGSRGRAAA